MRRRAVQSEQKKRQGCKDWKDQQWWVTIETPKDCKSSFEPQIVEKCQRILKDNLEKQIKTMYSLHDISAHIGKMYDLNTFT